MRFLNFVFEFISMHSKSFYSDLFQLRARGIQLIFGLHLHNADLKYCCQTISISGNQNKNIAEIFGFKLFCLQLLLLRVVVNFFLFAYGTRIKLDRYDVFAYLYNLLTKVRGLFSTSEFFN